MKQIAAVILAGGASTRLGEPKQLLAFGEERLLERSVRVASDAGCSPVVVVLGCEAEMIRSSCRLSSAQVVVNEAWAEGMASSIRCGVAWLRLRTEETSLRTEEISGTILMTCDQPAVTAQHLCALMEAGKADPVASGYCGRIGVPAYFPRRCFDELCKLQGDRGASTLLRGAEAIELPGGELDVDTPASLGAAQTILGRSTPLHFLRKTRTPS